MLCSAAVRRNEGIYCWKHQRSSSISQLDCNVVTKTTVDAKPDTAKRLERHPFESKDNSQINCCELLSPHSLHKRKGVGAFVLPILFSPWALLEPHGCSLLPAPFISFSNFLSSLAVDKSSSRGYDAAFTTNITLVAIVLWPQIHSISE